MQAAETILEKSEAAILGRVFANSWQFLTPCASSFAPARALRPGLPTL